MSEAPGRVSGTSAAPVRENVGMPTSRPHRLRRPLAALALLAALLVAAMLHTTPGRAASTTTATTTTPSTATPACGAATLATVTQMLDTVANNIYRGELGSPEVTADRRHVEQSAPLLAAVAAGHRQAAYNAVHAIVYHGRWHVVRLRILNTAGKLVAEAGGPYVLAPVHGELRRNGQVIGSYVMSVQDDYGYTILMEHAAGLPVSVYYRGRNVADTGGPLAGGPLPARQPTGSTLTLAGRAFNVLTVSFTAFPTGTVTAVILVPPPSATLSAQPCAAVKAAEVGQIARTLASRFHPLDVSYDKYAVVLHDDTGATVLLRIGPRALPGSQGLGPAVLPNNGPLSYLGRNYWVYSFAPTPPARIYLLVPNPV